LVLTRRSDPSLATGAEQPEEAQFEDEATAEAGIVDIVNILGTPTVTVVRSTLLVLLISRVVM
jgi:hypothetical protein